MGLWDILIIVGVVLVLLVAGLYFLNNWASKKMTKQNDIIAKTKQSASIYVIDKKRDKAQNVTLPKVVVQNLPKLSKRIKMNFIKAKIGPQIMTLMSDKATFEYLSAKKNFQVELSGIYIVSVKGMKTKHQLKQEQKEKLAKEKMAKRIEKATKKA